LLLVNHLKKLRLAAKITTNRMNYFYICSTTLFAFRLTNVMASIAACLSLFLPTLTFDVNVDDHSELHLAINTEQQTLNFTQLQFLG